MDWSVVQLARNNINLSRKKFKSLEKMFPKKFQPLKKTLPLENVSIPLEKPHPSSS